jgi:hypothetical protein
MSQRDTDTDTAPRPSARSAQGWRGDRPRTAWPGVHVDLVAAESCACGRRVRAVIRLGDLTPADVVVGLAPARAVGTAACSPDRRMWSSESYDNGRFVFERVILPGEDVAAGEWVVCVRPPEELIGRPLLYPLRLDAWEGSVTPGPSCGRPTPDRTSDGRVGALAAAADGDDDRAPLRRDVARLVPFRNREDLSWV